MFKSFKYEYMDVTFFMITIYPKKMFDPKTIQFFNKKGKIYICYCMYGVFFTISFKKDSKFKKSLKFSIFLKFCPGITG